MPRSKPSAESAPTRQAKFTPIWAKQIPVRFVFRVAALTAVACLGYPAFATWLNGLLLLAAAFCICVAEFRRESLFAGEFTHWDEAAAYGILIGVVSLLN